jgi:glycosyltransferase involved in cell wall biosynthesis
MKISVVVPCHQQGRFLDDALASITAQSRPPEELLLVDDGSTDDSVVRMRAFAAGRDDTQVLSWRPNRGVVAAMNEAIRRSTGDAVVVLCADDRLSPRYLELLAGALDRERWDLAYSDVLRFGAEEGWLRARSLDPVELGRQNWITVSAMFRRDLFDAIGGFDAAFDRVGFEDYDFWLRAVRAGARGGPVEGCHLEWRRHEEGSRNTLGALRWARARWLLWRRHPGVVARPHPLSFLRWTGTSLVRRMMP